MQSVRMDVVLIVFLALALAAAALAVVVAALGLRKLRHAAERAQALADAQAAQDREYLEWLQDHVARGVELLARGCASSLHRPPPASSRTPARIQSCDERR